MASSLLPSSLTWTPIVTISLLIPVDNSNTTLQPSAFLEREERAGEAASGYMSDGDILRSRRCGRQDYCSSAFRRHTDDSYCGYNSEGSVGVNTGASIYVKKMQQRFMEGIMAAQECLDKKHLDDQSR